MSLALNILFVFLGNAVTILEIFMKSIELIFKVSRTVGFFLHKEKRIGRFVKTPHTQNRD